MTDLSALIARVEEGTAGPDRELDGAIFRYLSGSKEHWFEIGGVWMTEEKAPAITASLDAVLSLIEQKLPGWCPDVGKVPPFALAPDDYEWTGALMGNEREVTYGHGEPPEMAFDTYNGHANSAARALLAATLRALSSLEDSKAGLADATPNPPASP